MSIDVQSLTDTMIAGVREAVGKRWPAIRGLAETELGKIAQTILDMQQMHARGEITADRASQYVEMQRNHALTVLITVKGIGLLTARAAVDAAAGAAGAVINRLVGFKLIATKGESAPRPVKAQFKAGKDI